jgi:hypothetical protein
MNSKKFEIIMGLMEELQEDMQYGKEDFEERLGRPKPQLEVMKMEDELPLGDEMEVDEPEEEMMADEESPDDKLKNRLMKLRG